MRKLFLFLFVVAALQCPARSIVEIWNSMPDSLLPYVDKNHRLEMTEFIQMGLSGDVDNQLGGKSDMDTLTADYLHVILNESSEMHLRRMPMPQGDSILCMVRTWKGPAPESAIYFFTQDWKRLNIEQPLDSAHIASTEQWLLAKPDTMTAERFAELKEKLSPRMVSARLFVDSNDLEVRLSMPFAYTDDKDELERITPPKRFRWKDGKFEP
jgi:hypothetical protein